MRTAIGLFFSAALLMAGSSPLMADEADDAVEDFFERLFGDDEDDIDDDRERVGTLDVCDALGIGSFTIPGTDECLQITGSVRYEYVLNPSALGAGTVRTGPAGGAERRLFTMPAGIHRWGIGASIDYGLGGGKSESGRSFSDFLFGGIDYGQGTARAFGAAQVGQGDTTLIALTFGKPDAMAGTGVFTGTPGFGLAGSGTLDNRWAVGTFGYGRSFDLGDQPDSPAIIVRTGVYLEGIGYNATGRADVTFNGNPLAGFYQTYDSKIEDIYAGLTGGLDYEFYPCERLALRVGGELNLAYHSGRARFEQQTGIGGGAVVIDRLNFDNSGLVMGGGLKVEADYAVAPQWTVGVSYKASVLPDVTQVEMRENPNTPELRGGSSDVIRHFVGLRVQRSF